MKITALALSLAAGFSAGCAMAPSTGLVAMADLPDCFVSNYDAQSNLFTIRNTAQDVVNQQCMLTVGPNSRITAGRYEITLANGGGGGAGGSACVAAPFYLDGGPGWAGSPSSIVHVATGEVVAGIAGADTYARPSRAQHDKSRGLSDGHGGSGPGQTSGGHGGTSDSVTDVLILAQSGQSRRGRDGLKAGGVPGGNQDRSSAGGGGGATDRADGGGGGGESPGHADRAPVRGALGSGGGGGEGSRFECDPGARGGHGFIALRAP